MPERTFGGVAFELAALALLVHVAGAVLWAGGAVFFVFMVYPAVRDAGPAGGAVMQAVLRRGGFGRFFGPISTLTVAAGLYMYVDGDFHRAAFDGAANSALTLGMLLGLVAWLVALLVLMPNEAKLKALVKTLPAQGPPPPEAMARFQALAMKQGKASLVSATLLLVALALMAGRGLLA